MRALIAVIAFSFVSTIASAGGRSIEFVAAAAPVDALVVAVSNAASLDRLDAVIGAEAAATLKRAAERAEFKGEVGSTESFLSGSERFGEIHLVGVGEKTLRSRDLEDFGGRAGGIAKKSKADRVVVLAPPGDARALADVAFGAALGQHSFDIYKTLGPKPKEGGTLAIMAADPAGATSTWNGERRHVADAVIWARDLQAEPANVLYPEEFVARARTALRGVPNVTVTVLDVPAMERLGMGAILGVGRGSARPPRMLLVEYKGGPSGGAPLAFVGKGITFDSGGLSLKPGAGMWQMKADMSGAAAAIGATMGLAKSRAPVNVIGIAALAENMPDGNAIRNGDVLKSASGVTIEILSTDAEGRLVLADALWYVQDRYKPSLILDIATLTGTMIVALADEYAGFFTRDDSVAARLVAAGDASGEEMWRMPMHPNYKKTVKSDIADVKNADSGAPGHGTAAEFISTFVKEGTPWAHLDIAGVDYLEEGRPTVPKGWNSFGVRLFDRLARDSVGQ